MKLLCVPVFLLPLFCSAKLPSWGCGLLGQIPGVQMNGTTSAATQKFVDAIKKSSSFDKVSYWNWNLYPQLGSSNNMQYLSKDFIFMPEQWGVGAVVDDQVRPAGQTPFPDIYGNPSQATMGNIFLGANEPDIVGSCMGNMFGSCNGSCVGGEIGTCPVAHLFDPVPKKALPSGHCNCYTDSHATGMGFWNVPGCLGEHPMPTLWTANDSGCVKTVMDAWKLTAKSAVAKGYKYLSAPLVAVSMDWMRSFVKEACSGGCSSVDCGCPTHVGWHFYANDCQPTKLGGYDSFQEKLDKTAALMEEFPNLMGAIVNEVGMLNCAMNTTDAICVPNGPDQKYPAKDQPNQACPKTDELPNGLGSFVETLVGMAAKAVTSDGRPVVASFSWFNEDLTGGTYNLQMFDPDGSVNSVGQAYMDACGKWANARLSR